MSLAPESSAPLAPELRELLVCPSTHTPLELEQGALVSPSGESYPIVNGVPWLLPTPQNSLTDWAAKLNHFNRILLAEVEQLEKELKRAGTHRSTALRIERLIEGKRSFIRRVSELLIPIVYAKAASKDVYDALRDRAPSTQNLLSYEANLYRDWVWGEEENTLTAKLVSSHMDNITCEKIAVLGAGAGRLALDIHKAATPKITVATDINPLLVMAAQNLLNGHTFSLYEFPLQPRSTEYVAIEHEFSAQERPENFHFVFSDATKPAFKKAAFDTVVTPWLIDIQPMELSRFLRQLNQYLPVGGHWINFGSLVFNQKRDALCYSIDEVKEVAKEQGFEIKDIHEHDIPYLKSPYNAGHRMEHVWTWLAVKTADVKPLQYTQNLPPWLLDDKQAVPKTQYFQQFSKTHKIYSQLATQVDGKISIAKIARKFSQQNNMDEAESRQLIKDFFLDIYRQNNP